MRIIMKKLFILCLSLGFVACAPREASPEKHTEGHASAEAVVKGPHRGRLLQDDNFAVELAIFETGVPPEFHAWPTLDGKPLPLSEVDLVVELTRLGGKVDRFRFVPQGDFLKGEGVVQEPHSFVVKIIARHAGNSHEWSYESFEGRTSIAAKSAEVAGIKTAIAGPAVMTETLSLYGQVVPNAEHQREVVARFPGLIRSVTKKLGDTVKAGEVLAAIESNESLQTYALTAPISGVLTIRDANPGEQSADRKLFTITDTTSVWAELSVFPRDRSRIRTGAAVRVQVADGGEPVSGKIARVDVHAGANQTVLARVPLDNKAGLFVPGTFVTAQVAVAQAEVPLAVKASGLQTFRDFTVVFEQVGDTYEVRMLELGQKQGEWVEVLGGLAPGARYVSENSYLIKADIEKSGASHDH